MSLREYTWNVLVAADQLVNTILRGRPGVTLSARAYTAKIDGRAWGVWLCKVLDHIRPNHSLLAVQNDLARSRRVVEELSRHE